MGLRKFCQAFLYFLLRRNFVRKARCCIIYFALQNQFSPILYHKTHLSNVYIVKRCDKYLSSAEFYHEGVDKMKKSERPSDEEIKQLIQKHSNTLYKAAFVTIGSDTGAQDAVQEAFF